MAGRQERMVVAMQRCEKCVARAGPADVLAGGGMRGGKYLTFRCERQTLGVDVSMVRKIIRMPRLVPLPDFPEYVKGVVCMQGEVIPVIDLSFRLNQKETVSGERACVVVFTLKGRSFGGIVGAVENVEDISEDEILPPPEWKKSGTNHLMGIVERDPVILLVDADFFINVDEMKSFGPDLRLLNSRTQNEDEYTGGKFET